MGFGIWISPAALAAVALAVTLGLRAPWWGVLAVAAACAVLTVAAVRLLARWSDAHSFRAWPQPPAEVPAREVPAALPPAGAPAIAPVYHFNFFTPAGDTHAAIIRKAITGGEHDAP